MAKGLYDFLFEFSSALGADEVSRFVDRLRRRGTSGTTPTQAPRSPARTGGDVDDAYFDLKASTPPAKQQIIWAWIQNLKRTREGQAAIKRLERDKNTARIKNMFAQGTEDEWNASIPKSLHQRVEEILPTLDRSTQEQMRQTLGGAARRQERWAAAKSRKKLATQIILCAIIIVFTLMISFPDFVPYGRTLINLLKNTVK